MPTSRSARRSRRATTTWRRTSCSISGYPEIKLLTNNPAKVEALREEGVDVIEQLPLIVKPSPHNKRYLATKKERMAHKL